MRTPLAVGHRPGPNDLGAFRIAELEAQLPAELIADARRLGEPAWP